MSISLQAPLERANEERLELLHESITSLDVNLEELQRIVVAVAQDIANNPIEGAQNTLLVLGWGVTLGYFHALKKVGDEITGIKKEAGW